jgi:hypothetical protein
MQDRLRENMNFIEVFLGLSPDNNTGSSEAAFFVVFSIAVCLVSLWPRFKRAKRRF